MSKVKENIKILEKLYSETARISWSELERFFAQGVVINVVAELDLLETAMLFAQDKSKELETLMVKKSVAAPTNDQARQWHQRDAVLWSVVVAPFVLVQDRPLSELNKPTRNLH